MSSAEEVPLVLPDAWLVAYRPSQTDLLRSASQVLTEDMLDEISRADHGVDSAEHLKRLRPIRDVQSIPVPIKWCPREVLELTRWSQPTAEESKKGRDLLRGWGRPLLRSSISGKRAEAAVYRRHTMRAFSCAALLRIADEPGNRDYFDGENQTLARLIESALFISGGLVQALGRFLTWRIPRLAWWDERPFFLYGLLITAALSPECTLSDGDLEELADVVSADECMV